MEESLKLFLSAHVVKGDISLLIYNWELQYLARTLDWATAELRHEHAEKEIKFDTVWMQLFGDSLSLMIPHFVIKEKEEDKEWVLESEIKDLTTKYKYLISEYLKSGLFSDRRGSVLFKVLDSFGVWIYKWVVCYYPLKDRPIDVIQSIKESSTIELWWHMVDITVWDISDIKRYENVMLLFKEVTDWYYDVRRHSIVEKQQWTYIQQEYCLGKDVYVEINNDTKEVIKVEQNDTVYNWYRSGEWRVIVTPEIIWYEELIDDEWEPYSKPIYKEVNTKDFLPYKVESKWKILKIWMYWAYTHILRDLLEFKPLTRQYKLLMNFGRLNFIAWCRRSWKTFASSYIILRELWKMPNSIRHISRQVRWLYIAPTEDKFKEVVDYIKKSSEKIRILKVVDFNKKENRLYLYDEVVSRNQKTQITVATCDFSSAKWYEPGRWRASDLVVVDEAAFVDENVWLNILPILENEKAKLFSISTIDWSTQRNWFYEQLIEAEKWIDKDMYWMRVTIDDIDDVLVDDWMRKRMKLALKHDQARYYAELYASLPEVWNVFNTEWFFVLGREVLAWEKVGWYIIWYDPAKRSDIWAVLVWEIRQSGSWQSYCHLIEEYELKWEYQEQKTVLLNIKSKYFTMSNGWQCTVIIDATQVWDVVAEMFWDIIDYKVWYTSKWTRPTIDDYGARKIAKNHLVHLSQILIEKWIIKAYIWLRNLMDELKNFKTIKTPAWWTKYEAEVWHDDHVNAMMLIWFFLWYVEWRVYEFWIDWQNIVPAGINPDTNLYESMWQRYIAPEKLFPGTWMWFWV